MATCNGTTCAVLFFMKQNTHNILTGLRRNKLLRVRVCVRVKRMCELFTENGPDSQYGFSLFFCVCVILSKCRALNASVMLIIL